MNLKTIFIVVTVALTFVACNSSSTNVEETSTPTKTEQAEEIEKIRQSVKGATDDRFAKAEAERLTGFLLSYAEEFPNDTLTPEFIFEAGNIYIGLKDFDKAIANFNRVAKHYPDYIKRPEVLYMTAFVYDYHMNQYGKAKEQYERVIDEYPTHVFAGESKNAIEILGMSDEELIERFKQQNSTEKES